jgi:uncharacterized membrane protein
MILLLAPIMNQAQSQRHRLAVLVDGATASVSTLIVLLLRFTAKPKLIAIRKAYSRKS